MSIHPMPSLSPPHKMKIKRAFFLRHMAWAVLAALCVPSSRAADVTVEQIQTAFAKTWTKAQYIQATKDYYAAKHPVWSTYLTSLSAGGNRFALAEVKPCAALYRETGDTKYSDAIRAMLVGSISNNTVEYISEQDFNYCYLLVRDSASVSAADRTLIENFISARMTWLMTQDSDTTFVRGMVNCAALAYAERLILPNDPNAATWRAWHQAKWTLGMARIGDVTEDASNYGPMWFAAYYEYLKVTGADVTASFNQPAIRNLCERNLQVASCLGLMPSYGRGGSYSQQGQMPGIFETMATVYQDGRFKAVAQRMFNYMRTAVDSNWIGMLDISAIPVFDQAADTVPVTPLTRPAVATYDRLFINRTFPDKLVMESGNHAWDSSVLMNYTQGGNHGHAAGSALVSFIDQASPLLINRDGDDDRVYHNLMMVRSAAEAFPFVPAAAGQPGQQYHFDNVRRRFTLNIRGPQATNGGIPDPASLSKLTVYLSGNTTDASGNSTVHLYIDNIKAVGAPGTLTLSNGTTSILSPGNWTDVSFGGTRDLSAYDTVEFGMRIEVLTPGAVTDVITLLQSGSAGGYHFRQALDVCSPGKTSEAQSFAKMQYASTLMNLKDTLGGDNLQRRDILLAPGGILLVRDRVTFPSAESNVQMGPVWNAAQVLSSGTNWFDLRQPKVYSLPQRQLLTCFPARTDSGITFTTGTAQDPKSTSMIAYQKWSGSATANSTRTFNSLLMAHDAGTSAGALASTVQSLQCDETATVLKIANNYFVINPTGASLNVGGLQTNAQSLYLETSGTAATYFAGTQGSSVTYSGTTLLSSGALQARFGSVKPILTVPANITAYAPGTGGTIVNFTAEALDNTDGPLTPVCTPPSGSLFPAGTTTVNCTVTNSLGQTTSSSFAVTVLVGEIWTSSAAGTWNTAANWSLGRVPGSTDPVLLTTNGRSFATVPQITVGATTVGALIIDSPTVTNVLNYSGLTPQVMSIYGLGSEPLIRITGSAGPSVTLNKVNLNLRVAGAFQIDSGKTFTLSNCFITENSAGLKLTKTGAGTLSFSGSGNPKVAFTGGLDVAAGIWDASSHTSCLPTTGSISFTNPPGTTASVQSSLAHSIEALAGGNSNSSISAASLTITGARTTTFDGKITGPTALNLTGTGSLALTNANPFTGATTVSNGSLALSGSLAGAVTVSAGGAFLPSGIPSINGNLTLASGSTFRVHINSDSPGAGYDQLTAKAAASLNGTLDIIAGPGLATGTACTILNKTSTGAVVGTFTGLPGGSVFSSGGYNWSISYAGGTGNDVVLTLVSALDAWRWTNFGTTSNAGSAADIADPNSDGESNLLEFATGQNPNAPALAATLVNLTDANIEFTYTRTKAALASGMVFAVEFSDSLAASSWSSIGVSESILSDNGTVQSVKATVPAGTGGRRFLHLKITK